MFSILTPELDLRLLLCQQMSDIYERGSLHGALLEVMLAPDSDKGREGETVKSQNTKRSWHPLRRGTRAANRRLLAVANTSAREGNGGLKQYPSIGSE